MNKEYTVVERPGCFLVLSPSGQIVRRYNIDNVTEDARDAARDRAARAAAFLTERHA